jgi:hypothetical protein
MAFMPQGSPGQAAYAPVVSTEQYPPGQYPLEQYPKETPPEQYSQTPTTTGYPVMPTNKGV